MGVPAGDDAKYYALPDAKTLEQAGNLKLKDQDGQEIEFKSLYTGQPEGERQLIIFIRHFLCGFCEDYIGALARDLPPKKLATVNTTLTIIGHGAPEHIAGYKKRTGCPYEIYCNPDRKLYDKLGMMCTLNQSNTPQYLSSSPFSIVVRSFKTGLGMGLKGLSAGKISQNGGEWLFEGGSVKWCKRMRDTSDHAEISELNEVLGL